MCSIIEVKAKQGTDLKPKWLFTGIALSAHLVSH